MEEEEEGEGKCKDKPKQPKENLEEVLADGGEHSRIDSNAREVGCEKQSIDPTEEDGESREVLHLDHVPGKEEQQVGGDDQQQS